MVLEVFTDSEDESRALEMFGNAVGPDAKDKAKDLINSVFGKDSINRINKLIGK